MLEPAIEYGLAPNTQLGVSVPVKAGNVDRRGSGDTHLKVLHNFFTESLIMPAFSIIGEVITPTGKDNDGVDTGVKLIATKSISKTGLDRVHLNVGAKRNSHSHKSEDDVRGVVVAGYSRRLNADTVLVADVVHEQEVEEDKTKNVAEIGVRRQLTPRLGLSAGVGAGLNDDSPDWQANVGIQFSLGRLAGHNNGKKTITRTVLSSAR